MARPHNPALEPSLSKSPEPPHKGKKARREKHPKLSLHNMSLYNLAPPRTRTRPMPWQSYISILCKIAARPTPTKGKSFFPSTLFGQCLLPPIARSRQKALHGVRQLAHSFALLSPVRQGAGPRAYGASHFVLLGGLPPPNPRIIFLKTKSPSKTTRTTKALALQKNVYICYAQKFYRIKYCQS